MIPEIVKEKCRCKKSFYWNLTQPYFQFEEGKIYDLNVRTHKDVAVYSFDFCDLTLLGSNFDKYFDTIQNFRNDKLNQLGI